MRLILYRALAGGAIALVMALWFFPASTPFQQSLMIAVGLIFMLLLAIQVALTFSRIDDRVQWAFQFAFDICLSGVLVFCTGGIQSPFSFLLGLTIIASGTLAFGMLPLSITILACFSYLAAVYGQAWTALTPLDTQQALRTLLQVSALMLAGGVMAFIARRHASLRARSDQAVWQHHHFKELHAKIMRSMLEGVIVLNKSMQVSDLNRAARQMLGSRSIAALETVTELKGFLQQPNSTTFECDYEQGNRILRVAVNRLSDDDEAAWLLTLVDITNIRNLEQRLVQQEKMAALGQMAAMLAHEIRNPIQTMAQGLELMALGGAKGGEIQEILHEEMLRLNRLATTMLAYSKPLKPSPGPAMMEDVIMSALHQAELRQRGEIQWQCNIEKIVLDVDHFRLVLDNLLSNAMANRVAGSTVDIQLAGDNSNWILSVSNEGEIPPQVQKKIFEPFISGHSNGIGLGLATVQQICEINGWSATVISDGGQVCFKVTGSLHSEAITKAEPANELDAAKPGEIIHG